MRALTSDRPALPLSRDPIQTYHESSSKIETRACGPSASVRPVATQTSISQAEQQTVYTVLDALFSRSNTELSAHTINQKHSAMKQKLTFTSVMLKTATRRSDLNTKPPPHARQSQLEPDEKNTRLPGATTRLPVERYVRTTRDNMTLNFIIYFLIEFYTMNWNKVWRIY